MSGPPLESPPSATGPTVAEGKSAGCHRPDTRGRRNAPGGGTSAAYSPPAGCRARRAPVIPARPVGDHAVSARNVGMDGRNKTARALTGGAFGAVIALITGSTPIGVAIVAALSAALALKAGRSWDQWSEPDMGRERAENRVHR